MDFFDTLNKAKGGHIFLSHSHDDIEIVRQIRNSLEESGFEPLCFYLKCLEDETEIADLIKREIDAREWFIFVDSENSRKSRWVTLEREYIARTNSKKIITIDINDAGSIAQSIQKIARNLRIYISYSAKDEPLARTIKHALEDKDYLVFFPPDSIPTGTHFTSAITGAITEAARDGCVLVLITENALHNDHMLNEIDLAFSQKGRIIPVVVGNADIQSNAALRYYLARYHYHYLSENPRRMEIRDLVDQIGRAITG